MSVIFDYSSEKAFTTEARRKLRNERFEVRGSPAPHRMAFLHWFWGYAEKLSIAK